MSPGLTAVMAAWVLYSSPDGSISEIKWLALSARWQISSRMSFYDIAVYNSFVLVQYIMLNKESKTKGCDVENTGWLIEHLVKNSSKNDSYSWNQRPQSTLPNGRGLWNPCPHLPVPPSELELPLPCQSPLQVFDLVPSTGTWKGQCSTSQSFGPFSWEDCCWSCQAQSVKQQ